MDFFHIHAMGIPISPNMTGSCLSSIIRANLRRLARSPADLDNLCQQLPVRPPQLRNAIAQSLSHISTTTTLNCTANLTKECQALSSALIFASQSTLSTMERRHQDWFDDNAADIRSLIHDIDAAHDALLRNPTSRTLHDCISSILATMQRKLR